MKKKEIKKLAKKYGVSPEAVQVLADALQRGNLTMAQFNHPELGGSGQWMQGGMLMIGDMFNNNLKATVNNLCLELATALTNQPVEVEQVSGQNQWQSSDGTPEPAKSSKGKSKAKASKSSGSTMGTMSFQPMASGNWWPADFGSPNSSGGQNNMRYAYFAGARRLVIEANGKTTIYDTGDHQIGGVSQQQSGSQTLTFTSQHGQVPVSDLKVVSSK